MENLPNIFSYNAEFVKDSEAPLAGRTKFFIKNVSVKIQNCTERIRKHP